MYYIVIEHVLYIVVYHVLYIVVYYVLYIVVYHVLYIYIYIYTRFAYGTWRCLWSRAKHSSKQCKVRSRAIPKGISKGIPQQTRKRCRIQRRLLEPRLRALTLGRRLRMLPNTSVLERWFRAPKGFAARRSRDFEWLVAAEHGRAVISSAKHALCGVFECCRRG